MQRSLWKSGKKPGRSTTGNGNPSLVLQTLSLTSGGQKWCHFRKKLLSMLRSRFAVLPANQPANQPTSQPINQPTNRPTNLSAARICSMISSSSNSNSRSCTSGARGPPRCILRTMRPLNARFLMKEPCRKSCRSFQQAQMSHRLCTSWMINYELEIMRLFAVGLNYGGSVS
ncbi:unnamed protein product [Amoebophrya sp. A25]|nr:unnamed protein product [Amoebophrya sp. A25]|eukprot:GSA25T00009718001.1